MKLYFRQFLEHLQQAVLHPSYLISGEETVLCQNVALHLRKKALNAGYRLRHFRIEEGFLWDALQEAGTHLSLWAERELIELHLTTFKFGLQAVNLLTRLVQAPTPERMILIVAPRIKGEQQRASWVQAVIQRGLFLPLWPLTPAEFQAWLQYEIKQLGLFLTANAFQQLVQSTAGHVLAAQQALEQLKLLYPQRGASEAITEAAVASCTEVMSPVGVNALWEAILTKQPSHILSVLHAIKAARGEAALLLWVLASELRLLIELKQCALSDRGALEMRIQQDVRLKKRQGILIDLISRYPLAKWYACLEELSYLEVLLKSHHETFFWDHLRQYVSCLGLSLV